MYGNVYSPFTGATERAVHHLNDNNPFPCVLQSLFKVGKKDTVKFYSCYPQGCNFLKFPFYSITPLPIKDPGLCDANLLDVQGWTDARETADVTHAEDFPEGAEMYQQTHPISDLCFYPATQPPIRSKWFTDKLTTFSQAPFFALGHTTKNKTGKALFFQSFLRSNGQIIYKEIAKHAARELVFKGLRSRGLVHDGHQSDGHTSTQTPTPRALTCP